MENNSIIWIEKPKLVKPYLLMAFAGWGNAGDVATSVIIYLTGRWGAKPFAEIRPDNFYHFQADGTEMKRPVVNIENGRVKSFDYISTNLWYAKDKYGVHDIILVTGPEPDINWPKFAAVIVDLAEECQVEKILAMGGTFDAVPHTMPPVINAVATSQDLLEEAGRYGIGKVNYQGASAVHSALMAEAASRQFPMICLWAHTPHYVQVTNYMATYALMEKLGDMLDREIDMEVAEKDRNYLIAQLDQAVEKKPDLKEYLTSLEVQYRKGHAGTSENINSKIVKEIEDILKEQ